MDEPCPPCTFESEPEIAVLRLSDRTWWSLNNGEWSWQKQPELAEIFPSVTEAREQLRAQNVPLDGLILRSPLMGSR